MQKLSVNNKSKSLKYVETYDKIRELIKNNNLQAGDRIPGENDLSKLFEVSRGTVRQAIALLQEDGLIYKQQGFGNIILDPKKMENKGLECINEPIFNFNKVEYSKIDFKVEFQPASEKMKELFEEESNFMIMLINVKYFIGDKVAALLMYFINFDDAKEYDLNLQSEYDLKKFIDKILIDKIINSELEFQGFKARESTANKMNINIGKDVLYFSEVMKKDNNKVSLYRRSYFIPEYFTFKLIRD